MIDRKDITGIVLSGGKSSRMGEEKGLAVFQEAHLVSHAIATLEPVCGQILISANNHLADYETYNYPVVPDAHRGVGPIGGISACLARSQTRWNAVISCDTPFLPSDLYDYLAGRIDNHQAAIPIHNGWPEPLCGIYTTNTLWYINDLISEKRYKMQDLLDAINCLRCEINEGLAFYSGDMFTNINTKNELKRAGR